MIYGDSISICAVDLLNAGDTFTGTADFDSCFEVPEHETSLIIGQAQGNVFKGKMVNKLRGKLRSRAVRGFFYVPGRQLIVVPEGYGPSSLSLVCSYDPESDNDADCKILSDHMTRQCGTLGIERDRTGQLFRHFLLLVYMRWSSLL